MATMTKFDSLSIERGQGATYSSPAHSVTVYGHSIYPRSSVLAGQECRQWLMSFDELDSREANIAAAKAWCKENHQRIQVDVYEGSSYQEPYLGHLPDDDDY